MPGTSCEPLTTPQFLRAAAAEGRLVVTEDVSTFAYAMAEVPEHAGVVFCHHSRFPRTRPGLERLRRAPIALVEAPPEGLGQPRFVWWLNDQ